MSDDDVVAPETFEEMIALIDDLPFRVRWRVGPEANAYSAWMCREEHDELEWLCAEHDQASALDALWSCYGQIAEAHGIDLVKTALPLTVRDEQGNTRFNPKVAEFMPAAFGKTFPPLATELWAKVVQGGCVLADAPVPQQDNVLESDWEIGAACPGEDEPRIIFYDRSTGLEIMWMAPETRQGWRPGDSFSVTCSEGKSLMVWE